MLGLSSCRVENFRALREVEIDLDSTTVMIGENGCGKSSLLNALGELGRVDNQLSIATLVHFRPLEAVFLLNTPGIRREIPLPEDKNVLCVARKVECPHALVEADAVPEESVCAAREALRGVLQRLRSAADPDPEQGVEERVMAPMSSAGSWSSMGEVLRGSGARSLAMLAFTGGFLQARGPQALDQDARPIVSIEDPETSLHPVMLNSVYELIQRLPGQKVITTNSADLLAALPMGSLRRLVRAANGKASVYQVRTGEMSLDEMRRVAYHLRMRRGTAFFMRYWLLVEGETEFWLVPEIARALGFNLRQEGIECLEFAQSGLTPLARLANHLGVGWYLLADGDRAGQSYSQQASRVMQADWF